LIKEKDIELIYIFNNYVEA